VKKTLQVIIVTIFVSGCLFGLAEATDLGLIGVLTWIVVLLGCVAAIGSLSPDEDEKSEIEKSSN
jgi:hypothetical protein